MSNFAKTRHRKREALFECPIFEQGQRVVQVTQALGENIYEVIDENNEKLLYRLPKRLRHVVYIRRGSFLFVRDETRSTSTKVCGEIEVVILDKFLRDLKKESFWPQTLKIDEKKEENQVVPSDEVVLNKQEIEEEDSDHSSWEAGVGNPNRPTWDDHSSDEDESSDDG